VNLRQEPSMEAEIIKALKKRNQVNPSAPRH